MTNVVDTADSPVVYSEPTSLEEQITQLRSERDHLKEKLAKAELLQCKQQSLIHELAKLGNDVGTSDGVITEFQGDEEAKAKANAARRDRVPNICYQALQGHCTRGDFCRFSHDAIPFPYCPQYNEVGKCDYKHCSFIHRLYEYIPPESKPESEKRAFDFTVNRHRSILSRDEPEEHARKRSRSADNEHGRNGGHRSVHGPMVRTPAASFRTPPRPMHGRFGPSYNRPRHPAAGRGLPPRSPVMHTGNGGRGSGGDHYGPIGGTPGPSAVTGWGSAAPVQPIYGSFNESPRPQPLQRAQALAYSAVTPGALLQTQFIGPSQHNTAHNPAGYNMAVAAAQHNRPIGPNVYGH